jgi:hypothetical protein
MNARILSPNYCRASRGIGWLAISAGLTLLLAHPFSASGFTSASGVLDLNSFSVTPSSGSIVWSGPWALSAFVSVNNSNGALNSQFQTDPVSASASASVPFASGNSSANFPAIGGVFGHVDGTVNIPGGFNAAAVFPAQSALENSFSITGASGNVDVTFAALLSSTLAAVADANGAVLTDETIFNLNVDGTPVLSFFDQVSVGPNGSAFSSMNPNLTDTISLDSSMPHDFLISLDPNVHATSTPESGETCLLLLVGWSAVVAGKRFLMKPDPATQRA